MTKSGQLFGTATILQTGPPGDRFAGRVRDFLFSKTSTLALGPPKLVFSENREFFFSGVKVDGT